MKKDHKYTVVFMDYLTRWPKVFPTVGQTAHAPTIATLLIEGVISCHGIPAEGDPCSFLQLSEFMQEVFAEMGIYIK